MKNELKVKQNGITLIALIITIIVLLILSGVTISTLTGENGLLNKAGEAKEQMAMEEEKERLELIKAAVAIDNNGEVPLDKYIEELIKEGITTKEEVTDNEDGSKQIITDKGYSVNLKYIDGNPIVIVEGKADALPVRIVNVQLTTSTSSIKVDVQVLRGDGATYKYYYKTESTEYKLAHEGKELSYTIGNLEQNVTYTIKVEAINENGTVYKEIVGRTGEVQSAVGILEFGSLEWNNGKAEVTIAKNTIDNLKIQYQILDEDLNVVKTYQEIESGEKITGINLGETVQARLWDGKNHGSTASITVSDTTAPSVTVTKGTTNTNSIGVTVSATDGQAGMPTTASYSYYIKKASDTSYLEIETSNTASYTFTGLAQNTSYDIKVTVADKAGNIGEGELKGTSTGEVTSASGAITFGNLSWSSNKASITVTKNTTDSLIMEYKISDGSYTSIASGGTISNLNLDDVVTVRLTDGTNYGSTASLTVIDTTVPNSATITLSRTTTDIESSIIATVTQSDSQSGVDITSCKWVYNTTSGNIGTNASSYTGGKFSSNGQKITLKKSTAGTYYLHVLTIDKAGNKKETVSKAVTITTPTYASYDIGDEVTVGGESFYVLEASDENTKTVTLLSKYNLNTDGTAQSNVAYYETACAFSSTNYWKDEYTAFGLNLNDLGKESTGDAIYKAKKYATQKGAISGRLLMLTEVYSLTDSYGGMIWGTEATDGFLNYWLGHAYSKEYLHVVFGKDKDFKNDISFMYEVRYGVRPVITVSKSLVS